MARLYTDENFPSEATIELRQRGHDLLTAFEAGIANKGISDPNVLAFATSQMRAVVTLDRHFIRLHRQQPNHAGIIFCTDDRDFKGLAERIDKLLSETPT